MIYVHKSVDGHDLQAISNEFCRFFTILSSGQNFISFFSFHLFIRHKGYKREKKMKKKEVLLFTISWRGSPKEASRLIENGLPQINR